jgi:hypothetical protein
VNRYIFIRRLRGPAILLLIGVLALLHQTGAIEHFWRLFWPLLLIMLGVMMLAERAALEADGGYPMFPWGQYRGPGQGPAQPGATGGAAQATGTAIVPVQTHELGNDLNGEKL